MKKFLLFLTLLLSFVFSITAAENMIKVGTPDPDDPGPGEEESLYDNVTFDFIDDTYGMTRLSGNTGEYNPKPTVISQSPISITLDGGNNRLWADGLRFYKESYFEISITEGTIKKIVIEYNITNTTKPYFELDAGSEGQYDNGQTATWEGDSQKVRINYTDSTGNQAVKTIKVYYEIVPPEPQDYEFPEVGPFNLKIDETSTFALGNHPELTFDYSENDIVEVEVAGNNATVKGLKASENDVTVTVTWTSDDRWNSSSVPATFIVKVEKKDAVLKFNKESDTATLGNPFKAPSLETQDTDGEITYSSSDPAVATVSDSGELQLVGAGNTIITARSRETEKYKPGEASYSLTVKEKDIYIQLNNLDPVSFNYGENGKVELGEMHPANLNFDCDPADVVTIDENGQIKALKAGETIVTVSWEEDAVWKASGEEMPSFKVTVNPATYAPSFEDVTVTESFDISLDLEEFRPSDLSFNSSDESVVISEVEGDRLIIKGKKVGYAILTAFWSDANFNAPSEAAPSINVTVEEIPSMIVFLVNGADYKGKAIEKVPLTSTSAVAENICSLSVSGGAINGTELRWYSGRTLTITPWENIIITKISWYDTNDEGTGVEIVSGGGQLTITGPKNAGYWEGYSDSPVVLKCSGQTRTGYVEVEFEREVVTEPDTSIAPTEIFFNPSNENIDVNTWISLAVDEEATEPVEIRYSIDNDDYDRIYYSPFTLTPGEHKVFVKATNAATPEGLKRETSYMVEDISGQFMITFGDNGSTDATTTLNSLTDYIITGSEYVSGDRDVMTTSKGKNGVKLGTENLRGSFTLIMADKGRVNAEKVIVRAASYGSDNSAVKVNGSEEQSLSTSDFSDFEFVVDPENVLDEIKVDVTGVRGYVKAITVVYDDKQVQSPALSVASGSEVKIGTQLVITSATEGATLYGSIGTTVLDGEELPYTFTFGDEEEIKVDIRAEKEGLQPSRKTTARYTIFRQVATPTLNVEMERTYDVRYPLEVTCETPDAKLFGKIGGVAVNGEPLPYQLELREAGEIIISLYASAEGYHDSEAVNFSIYVEAPDAPSAMSFSSKENIVSPDDEIIVTAEGADKMYLTVYGIDGNPTVIEVQGNEVTYKVDKMNRRFAVAAENDGGRTAPIEKFYSLGNRLDEKVYRRTSEASELTAGDRLIFGYYRVSANNTYHRLMSKGKSDIGTGFKGITYPSLDVDNENDDSDNTFDVTDPDMSFLESEIPQEVMILELVAAPEGKYRLRNIDATSDDEMYLSSLDNNNGLKLVNEDNATAYKVYSTYYDRQQYLMFESPNRDEKENNYSIQFNTGSNGFFGSYKINFSAQGQLPVDVFKLTQFDPIDIEYTMSINHSPFVIEPNEPAPANVRRMEGEESGYQSSESMGEGTTTDGVTTFSYELESLTGRFSLSVEDQELGGHKEEATDYSHEGTSSDCTEDHESYVYVDAFSNSQYTLVASDHENYAALNTHPNEYHDYLVKINNPTVEVSLEPFRNITMTLSAVETPTKIEDIVGNGSTEEVRYYNLQGIRVSRPMPGNIYIRVEGGKVEKIIF